MSAESGYIAELREDGFDDAADHLEQKAQKRDEHRRREQEQRAAQPAQRGLRLPSTQLVSDDPLERQRQADGAVVLDALQRSGVSQSFWAGGILGDQRRTER